MFGAFRLTKDIKSRQLIGSLMADIRPSSDRRIEAATVSATRFENGSCFPKYHPGGNETTIAIAILNEAIVQARRTKRLDPISGHEEIDGCAHRRTHLSPAGMIDEEA